MSYIVSCVVESLGHLHASTPGLALNGANLVTAQYLRHFLADEEVETLEVILPAAVYADRAGLEQAAQAALPVALRGRGKLHFIPLAGLPEAWADGRERVLWTADVAWIQRDRYLRDNFARGPMVVVADTHTIGAHVFWNQLRPLADAVPVEFDAVCCLSRSYLDTFEKWMRHLQSVKEAALPFRLELVPRLVDVDEFQPVDKAGQANARRVLRLPAGATISVYLGRVTPNDKADLQPLLQWFQEVATANDVLLIAGDENVPGYAARLKTVARELGLADQVIFHGRVDPSIRSLYFQAGDVFVLPGDSIIEGSAVTPLEAMACGLPVLASDWDGLRDSVQDGVTGFLIPTRMMPGLERVDALAPAGQRPEDFLHVAQQVWIDPRAWVQRWKALLATPALRAEMGRAGRARVCAVHNWPAVRERLFGLWETLLVQARAESAEAGAERRAGAARLGMPTPYVQLFSNYASGVWDPALDKFRLSAYGRSLLASGKPLGFYDQIVPSVRADVLNALCPALERAGEAGATLTELARRTGYTLSELQFHCGLLLKLGVVEPT